jgi:two-component system chemotaxis sensor kinase CheA
MDKAKYGLKFKILVGVTAILAVCTAFNLIYSYQLFVEDKTSYIFEAGLKKAENISDQVNFKIDDIITRSEFNLILLKNGLSSFDKLINNQSDLIVVGTIDLTSKTVVDKFLNTKNYSRLSNSYSLDTNVFIGEIIKKLNDPQIFAKSGVWIFSPNPNIKLMFSLIKTPENQAFFMVTDLSPLLEIFTKDKSSINKVVSLSSTRDRLENSDWISGINFNRSKKGTFVTTIKNEELLLSYVFVNERILAISSINKSEAFGITKFLILKTTLFALFLLGIALSAGIYFATSLTFPIIKLTNTAKNISEGDFSAKVEINTSDEIQILGNTFNLMSTEIQNLLKNKQELIEKLEDYNKNLEQMVAQRTLELKQANDFMALMVNSLDQGLLVFDEDLSCHPTFTKACIPIFGVSPLDKTIPEVLGIIDETEISKLKQWSKILFNEMILYESAVALGPKKKITGSSYTDDEFKYVQIDYYPMRDDSEKIINIVMIVTDKTTEIQATEKAKEKEAYVSMILKILNNKTQFESFISEVESIFEQFNSAYSIAENKIEFDLCMILFHTLNGGFGLYSMTNLQMQAREYETEISKLKDSSPDPADYIPFLENHVETLKTEFYNFRVNLDQLIGTKFTANESVSEVPRSKILELKNLINQTSNTELNNFYNYHFVKVPVINYFKAYDDLCKVISYKINKNFSGLKFENADLKIEAEPLLEFFNVLVHLFRNCLDHGIELPQTRIDAGKDPAGQIALNFNLIEAENQSLFSLVIQDDGAGINPDIIRARYTKLNPNDDISNLSDKEIIFKIFDPFFSTRDEVSAFSGRGVGMSAIKEVVDKLNGQIEIESHVGKGTIFSFLIPIPS